MVYACNNRCEIFLGELIKCRPRTGRFSPMFAVSHFFESVFPMLIADYDATAVFGHGFLFASDFSFVSAACQNELEGDG